MKNLYLLKRTAAALGLFAAVSGGAYAVDPGFPAPVGDSSLVPSQRPAGPRVRRRLHAHRGRGGRLATAWSTSATSPSPRSARTRRASSGRPATSGSTTPRPARPPSSAVPRACPTALKFDRDGNMIAAHGRRLRRPHADQDRHEDRPELHHRRAVRWQAVQRAQRRHHRRKGPHVLHRPALSRPRADLGQTVSPPTGSIRTAR